MSMTLMTRDLWDPGAIHGENRLLVANEPGEFEESPVGVWESGENLPTLSKEVIEYIPIH
jgi:hypothetical protein